MEFQSVHLANQAASSSPTAATNPAYSIQISSGKISSIEPTTLPSSRSCSCSPPLLLPSLCNPHIHLDKPFLLSSDHPQYTSLLPDTGTFTEALLYTTRAKLFYTYPDLLHRGSQLIASSIRYGVSSLRAFVEVDRTVQLLCLQVASALKHRFRGLCYIQIVAFAQDPLFSAADGERNRNREVLEEALARGREFGVEVLGTTPYVEKDRDAARANVAFAVERALEWGLHLDFHLDYNLHLEESVMVYEVLDALERYKWPRMGDDGEVKTIALGHCSRLTRLPDNELAALASRIRESRLPISFIGLPTSDLYMMGRPGPSRQTSETAENPPPNQHRPRGTLNIPSLIRTHRLNAALGINNLGNAFTPYGTADPLGLACWGVGIYQAGTEQDAAVLYECVSTRARAAIGLSNLREDDAEGKGKRFALGLSVGDNVFGSKINSGRDGRGEGGSEWRGEALLLFEGEERIEIPLPGTGAGTSSADGAEGGEGILTGEAKNRVLTVEGQGVRTVRDVVWCPPESSRRRLILPWGETGGGPTAGGRKVDKERSREDALKLVVSEGESLLSG